MAKKITRVTTKTGQIQYRQSGKIIPQKTGKKQWIHENRVAIDVGKVPIQSLTKNEKLSYRAQSRLRYEGKFLNNTIAKDIKDKLQFEAGVFFKPGADVTSKFKEMGITPAQYMDGAIEQTWFNKDQKATVSFGLMNQYISDQNAGADISVTLDGVKYWGNEAIEVLNEWYLNFYAEYEGYKTAIPIFALDKEYLQVGDQLFWTMHTDLNNVKVIESK
jgi:hypothetical protein